MAVLVGATVGAGLVAAWLSLPAFGTTDVSRAIWWAGLIFVAAWIVWALGLATVGALVWLVCERTGLRGPLAAALVGAMSTFAAVMLLQSAFTMGGSSSVDGHDLVVNGAPTLYGLGAMAGAAGQVAVAGAAVGWTVWRIAYRRLAAS